MGDAELANTVDPLPLASIRSLAATRPSQLVSIPLHYLSRGSRSTAAYILGQGVIFPMILGDPCT